MGALETCRERKENCTSICTSTSRHFGGLMATWGLKEREHMPLLSLGQQFEMQGRRACTAPGERRRREQERARAATSEAQRIGDLSSKFGVIRAHGFLINVTSLTGDL